MRTVTRTELDPGDVDDLLNYTVAIAQRESYRPLSIYVVNAAGSPLGFRRMEGASDDSPTAALLKAQTAALRCKDTRQFGEWTEADLLGLLQLRPGVYTTWEGGVTLRAEDGQVVGALAASGAEAHEDHHAVDEAGQMKGLRHSPLEPRGQVSTSEARPRPDAAARPGAYAGAGRAVDGAFTGIPGRLGSGDEAAPRFNPAVDREVPVRSQHTVM